MRPSMVVQYICFASMALCPWAVFLGVNAWVVLGSAAFWMGWGLVASFWHRRIEEA